MSIILRIVHYEQLQMYQRRSIFFSKVKMNSFLSKTLFKDTEQFSKMWTFSQVFFKDFGGIFTISM